MSKEAKMDTTTESNAQNVTTHMDRDNIYVDSNMLVC